jgi:hypothetical protein
MRTLAEIKVEVEKLPAEEKQELLIFLTARLRTERTALRQPRKFSKEEMEAWITEDDADMRRIREPA